MAVIAGITSPVVCPTLLIAQDCHWESLLGGGSTSRVRSIVAFDDGSGLSLYALGNFEDVAGPGAKYVAKWDGQRWHPLGTGTGFTRALAVFDDGSGPALFVGGPFTRAGEIEGNAIAKWDGREWSALGSGMFSMNQYGRDEIVNALSVFDDGTGPALYAGGHFDLAGDKPAKSIAKWNGHEWSAVGQGLFKSNGDAAEVRALAVFDDGSGPTLYAAGAVKPAGVTTTGGLVRWRGGEWEVVGGGVLALPDTLAAFDDGAGPSLFIGGQLYTVGGTLGVSGIARWDGREWSTLNGGIAPEFGAVRSLSVFDDGRGPALYVGGSFHYAGGIPAWSIARWDGQSWEALGNGLWSTPTGPSADSLAVFDDGSGPALYVGGKFHEAGGIPARSIARWKCSTCYADCDQSTGPGILDIFDFLCFGNRFAVNDPYACDCDTSTGLGVCDIFDFLCFGNEFNAGCS